MFYFCFILITNWIKIFNMKYLFFNLTCGFYILNTLSDEFLSLGPNNKIIAEPGYEPIDFYIKSYNKNNYNFVLGITGTDKVLDLRGGNGELINFKYHGKFNQNFLIKLSSNNEYMIQHGKQCLYYNHPVQKFILGDCRNTWGSLFKLYYSIRIPSSMMDSGTFKDIINNVGKKVKHKLDIKIRHPTFIDSNSVSSLFDKNKYKRNKAKDSSSSSSSNSSSSLSSMDEYNNPCFNKKYLHSIDFSNCILNQRFIPRCISLFNN